MEKQIQEAGAQAPVTNQEAAPQVAYRPWNMFRHHLTGRLDLEFLRVCSVHRLLSRRRIGFDRAVELLAQRKVEKPKRLVELWKAHDCAGCLP